MKQKLIPTKEQLSSLLINFTNNAENTYFTLIVELTGLLNETWEEFSNLKTATFDVVTPMEKSIFYSGNSLNKFGFINNDKKGNFQSVYLTIYEEGKDTYLVYYDTTCNIPEAAEHILSLVSNYINHKPLPLTQKIEDVFSQYQEKYSNNLNANLPQLVQSIKEALSEFVSETNKEIQTKYTITNIKKVLL